MADLIGMQRLAEVAEDDAKPILGDNADSEEVIARRDERWQARGIDATELTVWCMAEAADDVQRYLGGFPYTLVQLVLPAISTAYEVGFAIGYAVRLSQDSEIGAER